MNTPATTATNTTADTAAPTQAHAPAPDGPGRKTADGPGRPGPLVVNMPEAKVDDATAPQPGQNDLRLPHERDQSGVDATADAPTDVIQQAGRDLANGQVDTDLRNQAGLDAGQRQKLLRQQP